MFVIKLNYEKLMHCVCAYMSIYVIVILITVINEQRCFPINSTNSTVTCQSIENRESSVELEEVTQTNCQVYCTLILDNSFLHYSYSEL